MNLINLTPHALNILRADGSMLVLPPSGTVARCAAATTAVGTVDGITITRTAIDPATVDGLPAPASHWAGWLGEAEPTAYVVSRIVRDAVPDRDDVYCPGAALRDAEGRIVGCDGLSR